MADPPSQTTGVLCQIDRHEMVMIMVLARLQRKGKRLVDLSDTQIQRAVDDAVADLKLVEETLHAQP